MKVLRYNIIFLLVFIMFMGCYRGRPSEDPPIHFNPNMDSQPKYEAQEKSNFFENGATMRSPVLGTVARGELRDDEAFYFGKNNDGTFVEQKPIPITMQVMDRGRKRYNIYCSPCHDQTGSGQGIVVKKGYLPPPSFHIDRLRESPAGQIYDVITNGIRNMPSYKHQIPVNDRWTIVAYMRALQRSQNANIIDIPEEVRQEIK
jgi:hypothetical protein